MTDPIADMLCRIRNALLNKKEEVIIPFSKLKLEIAEILKKEGYIHDLKVASSGATALGKEIVLKLKYKQGQSVIQNLKRVSSPGRRAYIGYQDLPYVLDDLGIAIISTSAGLMTNKQARQKKVGGEVICEVY